MACWQALETGSEPALLREALGKALPDAPPKEAQMVKEPAMLHTTLARLLQPPGGQALDSEKIVQAVEEISSRLCGLTTQFE